MAEKKKALRLTTPAGVARYPWLNRPDTQFNPEGVYKVSLLIPRDEAAELCKRLDEIAAQAFADAKANAKNPNVAKQITLAYPYHNFCDDAGEETGQIEFRFKTNAKFKSHTGEVRENKLFVFDSNGKQLKECPAVYGGSILRVNFTPVPYYAAATRQSGVSLRINAVQILELVTGGGGSGSSYGFSAGEGSFNADEADPATAAGDEGSSDF